MEKQIQVVKAGYRGITTKLIKEAEELHSTTPLSSEAMSHLRDQQATQS